MERVSIVSVVAENMDTYKIGSILRQKRKEAGKTLNEVADDFISPTTISTIERGGSSRKTPYLAEMWGVNLDEQNTFAEDEGGIEKRVQNRLAIAETIIDLSNPDTGLKKLKEIQLSPNDPFVPLVCYLKGKCYFRKKKWNKAKPHFKKAVGISPQEDPLNIASASLNELSAIAYFQNNLDEAVSLTQEGIDSFCPEGERQYYKYMMMANKAIYLEKLDRNEDAMKLIADLWDKLHEIKSLDVLLNLYELKATIFTKRKMYHEAIELLRDCIETARINRFHQRAFSSWVKLGTIYVELSEWEEAEDCFLAALYIKENVSHHDSYILSEAYIELSSLYVKQEKWAQAEEMLEKALRLSKKHDDKLNLIKVLLIKGDIYRLQMMYVDAIIPYEESLKLSKECNYLHMEEETLHKMAACLKKTDQTRFQSCVQNIFKLSHRERGLDG